MVDALLIACGETIAVAVDGGEELLKGARKAVCWRGGWFGIGVYGLCASFGEWKG